MGRAREVTQHRPRALTANQHCLEGASASMPVSKRTRYEVLRRDNHTCRYCGGTAPDVKLTVDHVTPVALGGGDDPNNLVAACRDCNYGKASTSPSADLVEDVKQTDLKWTGAIQRVASARARQRKKRTAYVQAFEDAWGTWYYGFEKTRVPKPAGWQTSIERFYDLGVPIVEVTDCVRIACGNDRIAPDETFRYFAGCVWRTIKEMQDAAKELLDGEAVEQRGA